jgi:signal transduction histidine kinase
MGFILLEEKWRAKYANHSSRRSQSDSIRRRQSGRGFHSTSSNQSNPSNVPNFETNGLDNGCSDEDDDDTFDLFNDIRNSNAIALDTLNDLLTYEKIEGNLMTLETEEAALLPLVDGVIKLFKIQARSSGVTLKWDLSKIAGLKARVDVSKFCQVVRNMVSYALKFTPTGGAVTIDAHLLSAACVH